MTEEEKELVTKHVAGVRDVFSMLQQAVQNAQASPIPFVVMRTEQLEKLVQIGKISMWAIEDIVAHAENECDCIEEPPCW